MLGAVECLRVQCRYFAGHLRVIYCGPPQVLYYALLGRPSPVLGILDFYLLVPLSKLFQKQWRVSELTLRDRMGGGNFGQARPATRGRPQSYMAIAACFSSRGACWCSRCVLVLQWCIFCGIHWLMRRMQVS